MTEITVKNIMNIIFDELKINKFRYIYEESLLESLDFCYGNKHLQNPLNKPEKNVFYFRNREIPLTGNEIIYGDYLLYDCSGHDGFNFIWSVNSLDEIAEIIMDDGGIRNPFTTHMVAIVNGEVMKYKVVDGGFFWVDNT